MIVWRRNPDWWCRVYRKVSWRGYSCSITLSTFRNLTPMVIGRVRSSGESPRLHHPRLHPQWWAAAANLAAHSNKAVANVDFIFYCWFWTEENFFFVRAAGEGERKKGRGGERKKACGMLVCHASTYTSMYCVAWAMSILNLFINTSLFLPLIMSITIEGLTNVTN